MIRCDECCCYLNNIFVLFIIVNFSIIGHISYKINPKFAPSIHVTCIVYMKGELSWVGTN